MNATEFSKALPLIWPYNYGWDVLKAAEKEKHVRLSARVAIHRYFSKEKPE